ncbi:hypothetical protein HRJ45_12290 [Vibrio coralliilyticus]|uniref:hypothetical protein n=1 Tax=Vibrio coralliilyticus TaxID=190893 RepID=UPI00155F70BB|nr:hypothetical protein [Vibrio coralliilyticus]NRF25922.1 hypothetical protein [Vibrio coralliilyticus]NRF79889.1 hypothetical protein [Vibrio coralliilyticus]
MKKLVLALLFVLSASVNAGNQTGTVDYIIVRASDGLIYFTLKGGSLNSRPSCATIGYWMIRDENSNVGKQQYSMILSAHASGKTVQVTGSNTCIRWGDGEDVNAIKILNP